MGKYCADCAHFNTKKPKKEGVEGLCKCNKEKDKKKEFKYAHTPECDKFEQTHGRSWYECEKLYDSGKKLETQGSVGEIPWFLPIILAVIAVIAKALGFI